jgi:YgiT-type zinc finger domain-containing protein
MKCIICHSSNIVLREVEEEYQAGNDIIKVPITTLVCGNCGERYYDRKTMRELEKVREEIKAGSYHPSHEVGKIFVYQA